MIKRNKEEKLKIKRFEGPKAVGDAEDDPETVLQEAGAIGKNLVNKLMHAGEEGLDELNLERNKQ